MKGGTIATVNLLKNKRPPRDSDRLSDGEQRGQCPSRARDPRKVPREMSAKQVQEKKSGGTEHLASICERVAANSAKQLNFFPCWNVNQRIHRRAIKNKSPPEEAGIIPRSSGPRPPAVRHSSRRRTCPIALRQDDASAHITRSSKLAF